MSCPAGVIEQMYGEGEDDDLIPELIGERNKSHKRTNQKVDAQGQNLTLAILLQMVRAAEGRLPPAVSAPVKMVRKAYTSGARGRELGLMVAAAAATLAVGLRFGPGAATLIPGVIGSIRRGMRGGRTMGRGGLRVNAAGDIRRLLMGGALRILTSSGSEPAQWGGEGTPE